jgi:hypothetical protein
MHISNWLLSRKDIQFFFGFDLTPLRAFALTLFVVIDLFTTSGEVSQAEPLTIIMAAIATAGIATSAYSAHKASEAGEAAGRRTDEERSLEEDVDTMVTGVDRADVEDAVSQATTPIAGAVAAGQQKIGQDILAQEGGGGAPSQYAGRAAVLQQQLAKEGSGAVAQAALGAQLTAEQKGLLLQEQKMAARTDLAALSRQRKAQALQGQLGASQAIGGLGQSLIGGTATVMGGAGGQRAFS